MMTIKPLILVEWAHIFASAGTRNVFKWRCYIVAAINILMYLVAIMIDAVFLHTARILVGQVNPWRPLRQY
jgi:hypothetical protein